MITRKIGIGAAVLAMLLLTLAGAQAMMGPQHHGDPTHDRTGAMMHGAQSELDFLLHMVEHHQEAVDSSRQILEITEREEVQELARKIIAEQEREIELMRSWLAEWYPDEPHAVEYQPMMREDHPMRHGMTRGAMMHRMGHGMPDMMRMHRMMRDCMLMMGPGMPGMMQLDGQMAPEDMRMARMVEQMMGAWGEDVTVPRYDRQVALALAEAFLAGFSPEAVIDEIEGPELRYRVFVEDGDVVRVLTVDAMTGEVTLEDE